VHFSDSDSEKLKKNAESFISRFEDFGLILQQQQLELINATTALFPGLYLHFLELINVINSDIKHLIPWTKEEYRDLKAEKDVYPEFIPEEPPDEKEAVFQPIKVKTSVETIDLPDEEREASGTKNITERNAYEISTKKNAEEGNSLKENEIEEKEVGW